MYNFHLMEKNVGSLYSLNADLGSPDTKSKVKDIDKSLQAFEQTLSFLSSGENIDEGSRDSARKFRRYWGERIRVAGSDVYFSDGNLSLFRFKMNDKYAVFLQVSHEYFVGFQSSIKSTVRNSLEETRQAIVESVTMADDLFSQGAEFMSTEEYRTNIIAINPRNK